MRVHRTTLGFGGASMPGVRPRTVKRCSHGGDTAFTLRADRGAMEPDPAVRLAASARPDAGTTASPSRPAATSAGRPPAPTTMPIASLLLLAPSLVLWMILLDVSAPPAGFALVVAAAALGGPAWSYPRAAGVAILAVAGAAAPVVAALSTRPVAAELVLVVPPVAAAVLALLETSPGRPDATRADPLRTGRTG